MKEEILREVAEFLSEIEDEVELMRRLTETADARPSKVALRVLESADSEPVEEPAAEPIKKRRQPRKKKAEPD